MTERSLSQVLQDILETINYLEIFTDGVTLESFEANPEKLFAVVKALEITGEAVKKIPDDIRSQYPPNSLEGCCWNARYFSSSILED